MFRFAREEMLILYACLPVLVLLFFSAVYYRRKALKSFVSGNLISFIAPEASPFRYGLKFILFLTGMSLIILALAGPRIGSSLKEVEKKGREIIIALDVSNSMLAEDMTPNRIEAAKQSILSLLQKLENDRFGLIVFAGDAYTQIPVTNDFSAARLFLESVSTQMVSKQGTSIESAINLGLRSFSTNPESEDQLTSSNSRAMIIITDGEDHEKGAIEAAENAKEKGVIVHTIGLGDPRGVPIPLSPGSNNYKRDNDGNVVVTKLNESTLSGIAELTGGFYLRAGKSGAGLSELINRIDELEKETFSAKVFAEYEERYQIFLALGLFFLLIETILSDRRNNWINSFRLFKE